MEMYLCSAAGTSVTDDSRQHGDVSLQCGRDMGNRRVSQNGDVPSPSSPRPTFHSSPIKALAFDAEDSSSPRLSPHPPPSSILSDLAQLQSFNKLSVDL
jgi:hypothetical protein